jgi:NAD(P)-dependent dehydrogenase (short-subunit alcohol dehydrogenase family)
MTARLKDKIAIVTGAGSVGPGWGNGRAISTIFAEEGAKLLLVDRNTDHLAETVERVSDTRADFEVFEGDVTDTSSIQSMIAACLRRFGGLDILVNNVGGSAAGGVVELDEETWDAQLRFNLSSVFLTCKAAVPVMSERGGGSIVNIASASGIRYSGAPQVGYAAAKAGVIQLSRVTAVQYAPMNVRVNTVVPGQLHTPMVETRLAGQRAGGDVEALLKSRLARIPIGFAGDGRDTAYAALYLASDEARFVTGAEIVVDGGMTIRCD